LEMAETRRRFTRAEYYRMAETGILREDDRVELIKGEIIEMSRPGRRHKAFVLNLTQLLIGRLAGRALVNVQSGIVLSDDSEPEPDIAVLRRRDVPYKEREAHTDDVLLLIEVADSSLAYDRSIKLRLYAEAGIAEYWVVDCTAEAVEMYRAPTPDGYHEVRRLTGAAMLSPQVFPDVTLSTTEIFA